MLQTASSDIKNADPRRNARSARAAAPFQPHLIAASGNQIMLRLQRKCDCGGAPGCDCDDTTTEKTRKGALHRAAASPPAPRNAPSIVHEVLRSPGETLDPNTRAFFESRFRHDFSGVRIHSDARAGESARAVNALAYTVGRDIAFAPGRFAPATTGGRRLLAHELAHTVQQSSVTLAPTRSRQTKIAVGPVYDPLEQDADAVVERAMPIPDRIGSMRPDPLASSPGRFVVQRQVSSSTGFDSMRSGAADQVRQQSEAGNRAGCVPASGKSPSDTNCSAYLDNASWLPSAYVVNARCACLSTPDSPTANCIRQSLQDRLAATPASVKSAGAVARGLSLMPGGSAAYEAFVQTVLTPRIYRDHVDSYRACCCPSGPAPYAAWVGVTTVPIPLCDLVGAAVRKFGSCHGTPGLW
jgi:hypothetical protein